MRKWKVLVAVLAVACVAPTTFAQTTQEELVDELKALKDRVSLLETENAELKGSVATQNDAELELQINALTDRLVAGTTVKSAANPVTLTGEFRFRNTWTVGDLASGIAVTPPRNNPPAGTNVELDNEHDGSYNDALVRLGFQYEFTRDVTAFAELQADWAFGNDVTTNGTAGYPGAVGTGVPGNVNFTANGSLFDTSTSLPITLHQAWLEVRNIFGRAELSSRTGRQEIVLGNQFQFGNADWFDGFSFDATRWDWDSESFSLTAIISKLTARGATAGDANQRPGFFNPHDDDELYSLYFTLKTIKNHELDLYWIFINGHGGAYDNGSGPSIGSLGNSVGNHILNTGTSYFHTVGARIGGVFPDVAAGFDWNVEFAYQFGDQKQVGRDFDVDAFAVEAEVGLTFNKESNFRIYARFLWAEGPDNDSLGYIPLYPTRHSNSGFRARYGLFDLIPMTNVLTVQAGLHFDPAEDWTLGLSGMWATSDEEYYGTNASGNNADDDYGWEIDAWAEYRYSEHLTFTAGVAFLFPDDQGEALWFVDDDLQFLGFIQARLLF